MASSLATSKPSPSGRPIQLFLDFDGTITKKDTMAILAQAGYERQKQLGRHKRMRPWDDIVKAYMDDFKAHQEKYLPTPDDRRTIADEIKWLNSLEDIEAASAKRANDAHIFDDVTAEDLEQSAERAVGDRAIRLRSGFDGLVSAAFAHNRQWLSSEEGERVHVLSVNWSRHFVGSVIISATQTRTCSAETFDIYANEVSSILHGKQSSDKYGGVPFDMRTSGQKVQAMKTIIAERAQQGMDGTTPITVYVGDSATDLECLLAADYGICIRDEPLSSGQKELKETCERVGIDVQDLTRLALHPGPQLEPSSLSFVKDFDGICEWLKAYLPGRT